MKVQINSTNYLKLGDTRESYEPLHTGIRPEDPTYPFKIAGEYRVHENAVLIIVYAEDGDNKDAIVGHFTQQTGIDDLLEEIEKSRLPEARRQIIILEPVSDGYSYSDLLSHELKAVLGANTDVRVGGYFPSQTNTIDILPRDNMYYLNHHDIGHILPDGIRFDKAKRWMGMPGASQSL